jgi:hypothetical protein
MHSANVVMSSHYRARETLQNETESTRCNVKAARLKPDTVRVGNPETVIVEIGVGNEMFAVSPIRLKTVGETVESSDWHVFSLL